MQYRRSLCWTCTSPQKARPGVHASHERLTFRRPSNVVCCSGLDGVRVRTSTAPRQTWSGTSGNVNVAEQRDCPCACFLRASPSIRRGLSRPPLTLSCHVRRRRLQRNADVARRPLSPTRDRRLLGGACAMAFAPLACSEPSSSPHDVARGRSAHAWLCARR